MSSPPVHFRRRGFSLIEVLLATFILAIGLIMVATIFPVGAEWTRQATEGDVARAISLNAMDIIKDRYSKGGANAGQVASISSVLQGLPGLTTIPVAERTYQFGNTTPFPAPNPAGCTYYWTALARLSPSTVSSLTPMYDVYVLVFRKGEAAQTFTPASGEVANVRDTANLTAPAMDYHLEPTLVSATWSAGTYDATLDPPVANAVPRIGFYAIGATSGTVFRQVTSVDVNNASNTKAAARPGLAGAENVIYAPPADGTTASPLVYVYQTTMTF